MTTVVITGSASGMGAALSRRLRDRGTTVIGVDRPGTGAEVEADLATGDGRAGMVDAVAEIAGGAIDGLVAGAGVQSVEGPMAGLIVSVNYFGAVATLEGLRPLLARGTNPSAVAISSNSTTTMPGYPAEWADVLLAGDEPAALAVVGDDALNAYPVSKLALARWVRRGGRCGLDRPGHPAERRGAGLRVDRHDRGRLGVRVRAGRHLPDPDRSTPGPPTSSPR